jgi:hypothetical protein
MLPPWFLYTAVTVVLVLAGTALFFFTLTRGALILRGAMGAAGDDAAHVYPIYSNMRLIKLIDFQPIIAAILLFQYDRLVSAITHGLRDMELAGQESAHHVLRLWQRDSAGGQGCRRIGRLPGADRRHHPQRVDACQEASCPPLPARWSTSKKTPRRCACRMAR